MTDLHVAACDGDVDKLLNALKQGLDINERDIDFGGRTPLHLAITYHHIECSRTLVTNGADTNVAMFGGFTPLHCAAQIGSIEIIRMLLANGARADCFDKSGDDPLKIAERYGNGECGRAIHNALRKIQRESPVRSSSTETPDRPPSRLAVPTATPAQPDTSQNGQEQTAEDTTNHTPSPCKVQHPVPSKVQTSSLNNAKNSSSNGANNASPRRAMPVSSSKARSASPNKVKAPLPTTPTAKAQTNKPRLRLVSPIRSPTSNDGKTAVTSPRSPKTPHTPLPSQLPLDADSDNIRDYNSDDDIKPYPIRTGITKPDDLLDITNTNERPA